MNLVRPIPLLLLACTALIGCAANPPPSGDAPAEVAASVIYELEDVTTFPVLRNPNAMAPLLVEAYPPDLRDLGIEGSSLISMVIDERGRVVEAVPVVPSRHPQFDFASVRVARQLRYRPARIGSTPVAVRAEQRFDWTIHQPHAAPRRP